ncbi:MAG TPA: pilin [Candidatus Paceibacterota bacterium]|nr:pilin [Candidatus Paceibacterota bacterium]
MRKALLGAVIGAAALVPFAALAQTPGPTPISLSFPGQYIVTTSTPPGYLISNFYHFMILAGALIALGAIVYGGIKYVISAGNPSGQSDAKERLADAFLGLTLLVCAYLVLYTINPNLVELGLPNLSPISVATPPQTGGGTPYAPGTPTGVGCAGGQCSTLPNCTPSARVNCGGAAEMVSAMQCIQAKDPNFSVSEGYPPTGAHQSKCHSNGCCIDTVVPGSSCAAVNALIQAAQSCGASVANEYTNCNGTSYAHTTGGNVHINAPHINGC